jgi:hypothetical protein
VNLAAALILETAVVAMAIFLVEYARWWLLQRRARK